MNHAKKCQTIYAKKGQDGVFKYAGKHPEIPWRFCEPCGIESPIFEGSCLVCSTLNPEKTYIEKLFDNVNGGDCVDSAAELEEITAGLLAELILTKNALRYLIQETRARAGVPKGILKTAEYHADKAEATIAKAEGKI